jgi:hypothetical protein
VQRRGERQPHHQAAVGGEPVRAAAAVAQLDRRGPEDQPHLPVELAEAAEPGRERHVGDRQVGVVEQPAGEVRPPRAGELVRRHAEVLVEQPPQMARRQRQPGAEGGFGAGVQRAGDDQLDGAADHLRRVGGDRPGHPVGTAAQAGPEPGRFRPGGQLERANVLRQRFRPAAGPAVDAGGDHGRKRCHV